MADPRVPSDKIEITPEMIKAGVTAFLNFDSRFESEVEAVMDIYKAMVTARYHHSSEK